jgi:apolipoprotein N-acyltransferase
MRALELGRPMLRATNTGITSAIGHDGRELSRLPWFTTGILEIAIAGRDGATPYLRFGDMPMLALAVAAMVGPVLVALRRRRRKAS